MSTFHLQIVTPEGASFDGEAESLTVRATTGELTILPRHIDYVAALGMGPAHIVQEGKRRYAACIGGMLAVTAGQVRLIATTFEWADEIDVPRAEQALERAKTLLLENTRPKEELQTILAAKRRAEVRIAAAKLA